MLFGLTEWLTCGGEQVFRELDMVSSVTKIAEKFKFLID
jgi:hypothetical protein